MGTSIIILTYNHLEKTKKCIESIKTYTKNEVYEIIVVDNNSNDDTINWLKTQSDIIMKIEGFQLDVTKVLVRLIKIMIFFFLIMILL